MMAPSDRSQGTENVLSDLGFDDGEELSAKAALALKLNKLIDHRGLSQAQAAQMTCMTELEVSQVRCYKLQGILLIQLRRAVVSLRRRAGLQSIRN